MEKCCSGAATSASSDDLPSVVTLARSYAPAPPPTRGGDGLRISRRLAPFARRSTLNNARGQSL